MGVHEEVVALISRRLKEVQLGKYENHGDLVQDLREKVLHNAFVGECWKILNEKLQEQNQREIGRLNVWFEGDGAESSWSRKISGVFGSGLYPDAKISCEFYGIPIEVKLVKSPDRLSTILEKAIGQAVLYKKACDASIAFVYVNYPSSPEMKIGEVEKYFDKCLWKPNKVCVIMKFLKEQR